MLPEQGITGKDLIARTGFKPNYYYQRMRMAVDFTLSDLEALADALDVTPVALLQRHHGPTHLLLMDGRELGGRLAQLMRTYGESADLEDLVAAVSLTISDFSADDWNSLVNGSDTVTVSSELLASIADYFGVNVAYLNEALADTAAERVKAAIDLQEALLEAGATTVAARNLGEASPSVLRAIAAAIRTRPGD